jgi:hypothetical protein
MTEMAPTVDDELVGWLVGLEHVAETLLVELTMIVGLENVRLTSAVALMPQRLKDRRDVPRLAGP